MMDKADVNAFLADLESGRKHYEALAQSKDVSPKMRRAAKREAERLAHVIARYSDVSRAKYFGKRAALYVRMRDDKAAVEMARKAAHYYELAIARGEVVTR